MTDDTHKQQVTGWTGWVMFASIIMVITGLMNILYGIGSLLNGNWYLYAVEQQLYLINSTTGGWLLISLGILMFIAGALLMSGNLFGRIMGVTLATLNILAHLAYIGIAPVWSVIAIGLNILVIYAVSVHGGEMKHLE